MCITPFFVYDMYCILHVLEWHPARAEQLLRELNSSHLWLPDEDSEFGLEEILQVRRGLLLAAL